MALDPRLQALGFKIEHDLLQATGVTLRDAQFDGVRAIIVLVSNEVIFVDGVKGLRLHQVMIGGVLNPDYQRGQNAAGSLGISLQSSKPSVFGRVRSDALSTKSGTTAPEKKAVNPSSELVAPPVALDPRLAALGFTLEKNVLKVATLDVPVVVRDNGIEIKLPTGDIVFVPGVRLDMNTNIVGDPGNKVGIIL